MVCLASLALLLASIQPATDPAPPSELYPGLFEAVARARIIEPKDWVDHRPRSAPEEIIDAWEEAGRPTEPEALDAFVEEHFLPPLPVSAETGERDEDRTLRGHIEALWPVLTRDPRDEATAHGSLLPLPNRFLVPGGRFREVYYWDSYFTMLGLGEEQAGLKRAMADNFASEIARYGFIPNGNRSYYLSRSQPPFFFMAVSLLNGDAPEEAFADYLPALKKEHAFWVAGAEDLAPGEAHRRAVRLKDGTLLNRYWDDRDTPRDESWIYDVETAEEAGRPEEEVYRDLRAAAESGWDFSSRWVPEGGSLADTETTAIVPVDLNSILYGLERAIAAGCAENADEDCAADFSDRADARGKAIRRVFWDSEEGYFADLDLDAETLRSRPTAAMVYPLFFEIASGRQARRTARSIEEHLLAPRGLATTPLRTGQQWDAPNGWAPLHWMAVQGLSAYGHDRLADEIAERWVRTVALGFCESGKLVEKYDVYEAKEGGGGEYPTQDGFGWTNGVTLALIEQDPDLEPYASVRARPEEAEACTARIEALD